MSIRDVKSETVNHAPCPKMNIQHTPGPWQFSESCKQTGITIWRSDGEGRNFSRICRNVIHEENARLIAASPDLLDACKSAVAALTQNATFPADIALAVKNLTEAIQKATNEH